MCTCTFNQHEILKRQQQRRMKWNLLPFKYGTDLSGLLTYCLIFPLPLIRMGQTALQAATTTNTSQQEQSKRHALQHPQTDWAICVFGQPQQIYSLQIKKNKIISLINSRQTVGIMPRVLHMHYYDKNCFLLQILLSCSTRHWEKFAGTALSWRRWRRK